MKYERTFNFSAGPAMMPEPVLEEIRDEMMNYHSSGMCVMEMSHRSKVFKRIRDEAEQGLRDLMDIPDNYQVLFVQGGASTQFAAVPLNLMHRGKADYIVTGNFAKKAWQEGKIYGDAACVASSEDKTYTYIPDPASVAFREDTDYVHICSNNTIFGTRYAEFPRTKAPLVADMSSEILSREIDVRNFGVIYAGAQKNLAPVLKIGGVKEIQKINEYKAGLLYDFIDNSPFYTNRVEKKFRSIMNVPFVTPSAELDAKFVKEASANGLVSLKGHRLVGGMRASIYNAMPVEGVQALIAFMKQFEKENA